MVVKFEPIAIVGLSALFPGSKNARGFWKDIVSGKDLITEVPTSHWLKEDYFDPKPKTMDKVYCTRGSFLENIDFNPMEYGIPPNNLSSTDSSQLLALIATKQLLKDTFATPPTDNILSKISVILGTTSAQELIEYSVARLQQPIYEFAMSQHGLDTELIKKISASIANLYVPWNESTFPGLLGNVVAGRICNRFNFGGTNCVCDAACASTLAAISMAVNELQLGQSDMVITGGADTLNSIFMYMCFSQTPALSITGDCRPFAENADGTLLAEGVALFALKRLEEAERDKNKIYAVIKGVGSSSDGKSKSVYAPVAQGQAKCIIRGFQTAGYLANTVELIEAHGTATLVGDVEEFNGLKLAFRELNASENQFCAIGSIKSQIGHAKAAAGAAGLLKTVLALSHCILPPSIKINQPNPKLRIEQSPFYLNVAAKPWIRSTNHPRRAGLNSFGFGGSNFHVALEEYTGTTLKAKKWRYLEKELIVFCAENKTVLRNKLNDLLKQVFLPEVSLAYLANFTQVNYQINEPCRLAIVSSSIDELKKQLKQLIQKPEQHYDNFFSEVNIHYSPHPFCQKIAFVFPGQSSPYLYMGSDIAMAFNRVREYWDLAANFPIENNEQLHTVVFPQSAFTQAEKNQQYEKLTRAQWAQPAMAVTNHTYGSLLRELEIKPDVLIGHSLGEINALAYAQAISENDLLALAMKRGELFSQQEKSSDGSKEMESVAQDFLDYLDNITLHALQAPVFSCTFNRLYVDDTQQIKTMLAKQVNEPIHFQQAIKTLSSQGINFFVEVGPNQLLSKVIKEINPNAHVVALDHKENSLSAFWNGLGYAFIAGINPNFKKLWEEYEYNEKPSEVTASKKFTIEINGTTYNKPYPKAKLEERKNNSTKLPILNKNKDSIQIMGDDMSNAQDFKQMMDEFIKTCQMMQQQLAESQKLFGKTLKENQDVFLNILNNLQTSKSTASNASLPPPTLSVGASQATPTKVQMPSAPTTEGVQKKIQVEPTTSATTSSVATPPASAKPLDKSHPMYSAIIAIVAEKTGYPEAMLEGKMNLEADLGIDSIKRVEILSAMQEKVSSLPNLDPAEMALLNTIDDIVKYIQGKTEASSPSTNIDTSAPSSPPVSTAGAAPAGALNQNMLKIMMEIVAEKTGYPQEMLNMSMNLEADLGIDSIKRVEILSAMQEKVPSLSNLDPTEMAALSTIGDIVMYISSKLSSSDGSGGGTGNASPGTPLQHSLDRSELDLQPNKESADVDIFKKKITF